MVLCSCHGNAQRRSCQHFQKYVSVAEQKALIVNSLTNFISHGISVLSKDRTFLSEVLSTILRNVSEKKRILTEASKGCNCLGGLRLEDDFLLGSPDLWAVQQFNFKTPSTKLINFSRRRAAFWLAQRREKKTGPHSSCNSFTYLN